MKDYKTMAMTESHEDDIHMKFYYELRPYITNHYISTEEQIFMGICDFMDDDENQEHHFVKQSLTLLTEEEMTSYIKYLVNQVMKVLKSSKYPTSKSVQLTWDNEKTLKTQNGILVRYTNDGKFISLKTLTPLILIMSLKDSKLFFKELEREIDTLTSPELYKFITDYKTHPKDSYWKKFKTLKTIEESVLVELGIDTNTNNTNTTTIYEAGRGLKKFKQKSINKKDLTISVFEML